jgi:rod shape-determining protein MreC
VITEAGDLVGVVSVVETNSSIVVTVLDTTFSVGAYIERNDERAIAAGDFTLMKEGLLKFNYLQDTEIIAGDTIITSGKGGVLPSGLVIGTVSEVVTYSTGLDRYATIKPAADLKSLANVYLITSFEISGEGK